MDFVMESDKGERVNRFRQYLLTKKRVNSFSSAHKLAGLVLAAVAKHLEESTQIEEANLQKSETASAKTPFRLPETVTRSEIFISYKREGQPEARKLAHALGRECWTVWWDPKLRAGEHFDDVIEQALTESKCVVVMWSKLYVNSRYVKDGATYALNRRKTPLGRPETNCRGRRSTA
jgi:hypothetical protein